jgi:hypothetical protein
MRADVLAGQDDGRALPGRSPDPVEDTASHDLVEPGEGIVEQPDPGQRHAKPRQRQLLLLPSAQVIRSNAVSRRQAGAETPRAASFGSARWLSAAAVDRDQAAENVLNEDPTATKPPQPFYSSRREESPEVIEGGASRRGSERAARDQARDRGPPPHPGESRAGAPAGAGPEQARATITSRERAPCPGEPAAGVFPAACEEVR